ncbi:isocitrate dehydrogenase, putative, partial [Eimeria necatrix]
DDELLQVPRLVPTWEKPIIIGRHAFGDQYQAVEFRVPGPGTVKITYTPEDGGPGETREVHRFEEGGVCLGMFNQDSSIRSFAAACFCCALEAKMPLYLSTKNTVLKTYDGRFKDIFQELYDKQYEHRLVDDMFAYLLKSRGGFVWACKNFEGDLGSDLVAQGFGSLGMMVSFLESAAAAEGAAAAADGAAAAAAAAAFAAEAAHGTVRRHFLLQRSGCSASSNPVASAYAWARGLLRRGQRDSNLLLQQFAAALEAACCSAIEAGVMTKDLATAIKGDKVSEKDYVDTKQFIKEVQKHLEQALVKLGVITE